MKMTNYLAAVLVRGTRGARAQILDALDSLRLRKKHICVVLPETKGSRGAMLRCKDYIAYGIITEDTKQLLEEKRGQKTADGKLKPFFRLAPPRGGYERKGMKKTFAEGGVLGDRGAKIDDLIKKMM
jgi:large subunit ribosomal protein L30